MQQLRDTSHLFGTTVDAAPHWASDLEAVAARIGARFARSEPRQRTMAYLRGLVSPVERRNGWQLAEVAGDEMPYGVQHLLGRAVWNADAVRDDLHAYVVEHLGDSEAVLVVDETGFLKQDTKSVGVARQYSGTAGHIENCQIGVFLVYATGVGRIFLNRELYLPREGSHDAARCAAAGVPAEVRFAMKPQLAQQMIVQALTAGAMWMGNWGCCPWRRLAYALMAGGASPLICARRERAVLYFYRARAGVGSRGR